MKKKILIWTAVLCMILAQTNLLYARETTGASLMIIFEDVQELCPVTVEIFKTAEVTVSTGMVSYESLTGDYDFSDLSARENLELAQQLAQILTAGSDRTLSAVTDESGRASFDDIETGIYLVTGTSGTESAFAPFLVTVPQQTEEGWDYNVVCMPKTGSAAESADADPVGTAAADLSGTDAAVLSSAGEVKTGDRKLIIPAAVSAAAILLLILIAKRERKDT